jgi:hypothetical protein
MTELLDELERRIEDLRVGVRRAAKAGDSARARELRGELRRVEQAWDDALTASVDSEPETVTPPSGSLLTVRDQVHQALTLLSVPSAPKLIVAVNGAFFGGDLAGAQLTSLKRDEERSFQASPHARPFYLCGALTADRLVPARGLLAVSTWSMSRRVIGPLSPRVDFLVAARRMAEQLDRISDAPLPALRLLWQFAANIPDAATSFDTMQPLAVIAAAEAELAVHSEADQRHREASAERARTQLDEIRQLFGSALKVVRNTRQS